MQSDAFTFDTNTLYQQVREQAAAAAAAAATPPHFVSRLDQQRGYGRTGVQQQPKIPQHQQQRRQPTQFERAVLQTDAAAAATEVRARVFPDSCL